MGKRRTFESEFAVLQQFLDDEWDNRSAAGLPVNDPYITQHRRAQEALARVRNQVKRIQKALVDTTQAAGVKGARNPR